MDEDEIEGEYEIEDEIEDEGEELGPRPAFIVGIASAPPKNPSRWRWRWRWRWRAWAATIIVIACGAGLLGVAAVYLLHRFDDGSGTSQITAGQFSGLHLTGVWNGPDGSTITLSDTGKFTLSHIPPDIFVVTAGQWPKSDVDGTWSLGPLSSGQWSEQGLVLTGTDLPPGNGNPPQAMLLPIGSPSSPQLACYFPVDAGVCVFTRR